MMRLVFFLVALAALATGLSWLADRPGDLVMTWQGYEVQTSVFRAVVILALLVGAAVVLWSVVRQLWHSPAAIGNVVNRRRQARGMEALSGGMIAIGAGDRTLATRYAAQARKALPNEPMTQLLRAQAAQLSGDRATARRIFEAMLGSPETEQLGLRGLYLEAEREGEQVAARQFAERALHLNPKLSWPVESLFELQCKKGDWEGALDTLTAAKRNGHIDKASADRRRAVVLAARAQQIEEKDPERAHNLALEAHGLARDLVPAAAIAGRYLAARGNTAKAARVLQETWKRSPHPDLAAAYAYARPGDSPRDRLDRVQQLARTTPHSIEAPIAVAMTAIEAKDWEAARSALRPLIDSRLTQRICTLMARIEGEELGDKGRVREWLARAVNAPRDPAWTADGYVSDKWLAVSPVTGAFDVFQWKVPAESIEKRDTALIAEKLEELVALGAPEEKVIEATPIETTTKPAAAAASATAPAPSAATIPAQVQSSAAAAPPTQQAVERAATAPVAEPVDATVHSQSTRTVAGTVAAAAATVAASVSGQSPAPQASDPVKGATTKPGAEQDVVAKSEGHDVSTTGPSASIAPASSASEDDRPLIPRTSGNGLAARLDTARPQPNTKSTEVTIVSKQAQAKPAGQTMADAERDRPSVKSSGRASDSGAATDARDFTQRTRTEPRIFVSPRPPDDPGLESGDEAPRQLGGFTTGTLRTRR